MGTKISALPAAGALDGTEILPLLQSSANKRTTAAALAALASGGSGGSSLPTAASFSATVPLDGNKVMAAQPVSGAIAFTPGPSPVLGAQTYVRLTADGSHAPTFAGFTEHGGSAGYLNTSGVINMIRFWYDGTTPYFAVSQALNAVPFVMQSAAVASGTPTQIQITFDRALNASIVPAASAFAITDSGGTDTVSAVAISGSTVTLTKSRTTLSTDTVSVAYTAPGSNPITDGNGNVAGSSSIAVSNGVGAGTGYLRYDHHTGVTETAHSGGGWDYTPTTGSPAYSDNVEIYSSSRLSATWTAPQWVAHTVNRAMSGGPVLALHTDAAPTDTNTAPFCMMDNTGYSANWIIIANGSVVSGITNVAVANGDMPRLRAAGTSVVAEVSKDGGSSYTTIYTWTGVTPVALTPMVKFGSDGTGNAAIAQARCSTNVA